MYSYLRDFFDTFGYERYDADHLLGVYRKIESDERAYERFLRACHRYDEEIDCDYYEIIADADKIAEWLMINEYTAELLIFICLSKKLRERYIELGIDLSIYRDSMLDLKYKLDECKVVKGIVGSFVASWFSGFFALTRFALGRLQFEIIQLKCDYEREEVKLPKGSNVINVHIPRTGTPIDKESCDESYLAAKEFFKDKIDGVCAFVCSSWLLYPENKDILSKSSNTYRFMSEYDIIEWGIKKNRDDLWRLFDTDEKNVERLPADTGMRRAYIEHMKNGGKVGYGFGIRIG
jgi:hypothetical protein